jgi:membrane protein YdbS with pleckstrin-like domain
MYCPNCGKIIDDNSLFCKYCGADIVDYRSGKRPAENKKEDDIPLKSGIRNPKDLTMLPDERPVWSGRLSYLSNFGLVLLGILTIWIFGLGLVFILLAVYRVHSTEYFVSDRRVYIRYGRFSRKIFDLRSEWITNVSVSQGFLGRVAGYGDITVSTPGERGGYQKMIGVRHVMQVKSLIDRYSAQHNR